MGYRPDPPPAPEPDPDPYVPVLDRLWAWATGDAGPMIVLILGVALASFGGVSWHCDLPPDPPPAAALAGLDPDARRVKIEAVDREAAWRQRNAVVPLAAAVPLTLVGAIMCVGALVLMADP